jgi:hypothetical protein
MEDLRIEIQGLNKGITLATTPRYMTHLEKRIRKTNSWIMIAVSKKDMYNTVLGKGIKIFRQIHRAMEYYTARPTDQCKNCQKFGHNWQRDAHLRT